MFDAVFDAQTYIRLTSVVGNKTISVLRYAQIDTHLCAAFGHVLGIHDRSAWVQSGLQNGPHYRLTCWLSDHAERSFSSWVGEDLHPKYCHILPVIHLLQHRLHQSSLA